MAGKALCALLALAPTMAQAVSEEPIGASPQHQTIEPASPAPRAQPAPPVVSRPTVVDPELAVNPPPAARVLQPHATFPYTLRPCDNLGLIGAEFGVSVADLSRINRVTGETALVGAVVPMPT